LAKKETYKSCSKCSEKFEYLNNLDNQTKKKLEQKKLNVSGQYFVCKNCFSTLINEAYSSPLEKKIRIQLDMRKQKLWIYRMNYLKKAQEYALRKNIQEAIKNYQTYLKILEDYYEVPIFDFNPSFFVSQKDRSELNVISTVYFELTKLLDNVKDKDELFETYLEKFILFAPSSKKGRILAENFKKYAYSKYCFHKPELIEGLKKLKKHYGNALGGACYIATVVFNDYESYEVKTLRAFRDSYLNKNKFGRFFVYIYYNLAPCFVKFLKIKVVKVFVKKILLIIIKIINNKKEYF